MSPAGCSSCRGAGRVVRLIVDHRWGLYVGIPIVHVGPGSFWAHSRCHACGGAGHREGPERSDVEALEAWCEASGVELVEPEIGAARPLPIAGVLARRA